MKKKFVSFALSMLIILSVTAQDNYSKVRISLTGKNLRELAATGIDVNEGILKKGIYFETDLSSQEIAKITAAGFSYEIRIANVSKYYAERSANDNTRLIREINDEWPTPANWEYGSMGGFYTLDEAMAELDSMFALYPNLITQRQPISTDTLTHEGRMLYWVRLSDNPNTDENEPEVLYTGIHHAREPMSVQQMIWYMWHLLENYDADPEIRQLVDATEMYFVPILNPDGYAYNYLTDPNGGGMWRKNRRNNGDGSMGVDPNRNYDFQWGYDNSGSSPIPSEPTYRGPSPFSEPEMKNIRDFCNAHEFKIALNYHSYSNLLLYVWGWTEDPSPDDALLNEYAVLMTKENAYTYGPGSTTIYPTNGGSDDWMYGEQDTKEKILSYTPEVGHGGDGFWPQISRIAPLCREQMWQNIHAARLVGKYATLSDKAPLVFDEEGGFLAFEIKRLGLTPTDTFTVSITPLGDNLVEVGNPHVFENMELLQSETDSISYVLAPGIENGATFRYLLSVDNGEFVVSDTIEKVFGTEVEIFSDKGDDMANWSSDKWALTNTNYYSPEYSFTDSPLGNYQDEQTNPITLDTVIDLTDVTMAFLRFWASWDIEAGWDYLQVDAKAMDNGQWTPLLGNFTKAGSGQFQPTGEPVYDGQSDWVREEMNISGFAGEKIKIRFTLYSDQAVNEDGFYFDDLSISVISGTVGIDPATEQPKHKLLVSKAFPNPAKQSFKVSYQLSGNNKNARMEIYDAIGNLIKTIGISNNSGVVTIPVNDVRSGVYFYRLVSNGEVSATQRMLKQ
ncbi:MAG: immune inhibitor A [Bacteroidales bacterium]|nr:immune inhibitor A [Bacteroidales bacterium]